MHVASITNRPPVPVTGHIHSVNPSSTTSGPGTRFVTYVQGCPLRCLYCQSPDCRHWHDGSETTVDDLVGRITAHLATQPTARGVTISGGEPLMQPQFVRETLRHCKALGLHTALDTSGYCQLRVAEMVMAYVDLVLLDIKSFDPSIYAHVTSVSVEPTLNFARYLSDIGKPIWIRFVLVPGLTDLPHNVAGLADFVATLKTVERVEVVPFNKMGEQKWAQLDYDYHLWDIPPPDPIAIAQAQAIFRERGLPVM